MRAPRQLTSPFVDPFPCRSLRAPPPSLRTAGRRRQSCQQLHGSPNGATRQATASAAAHWRSFWCCRRRRRGARAHPPFSRCRAPPAPLPPLLPQLAKDKRENVGVELYGFQQNLAKLQVALERAQQNYAAIASVRLQAETELDRMRSVLDEEESMAKQDRGNVRAAPAPPPSPAGCTRPAATLPSAAADGPLLPPPRCARRPR